jgi:hypothetical protein
MRTLAPPTLVVPPGATDTHMHIYDTGVPASPGAPALPGHFPVEAYRAMQQRVGLTRVVVVQPNAYGPTIGSRWRRSRPSAPRPAGSPSCAPASRTPNSIA